MSRPVGGRITLVTGGLLLLIGSRVLPANTPAIYDGLCTASPYVGLNRAHAVSKLVAVVSGQSPTAEVTTTESPPQAQLILPQGALDIPAGVAAVRLSITPVPTPATLPSDGTVDGTVYWFTATTEAGVGVPIQAGQAATILLRATTSDGPGRQLEHLDGPRWTRLDTSLAGCADTSAAAVPALGDFALVRPMGLRTSASASASALASAATSASASSGAVPESAAADHSSALTIASLAGLALVILGIVGTARIRTRRRP